MSDPAPLAIELSAHGLQVQWPDGSVHLPADRLRAACRCGGCRARAEHPAPVTGVELVGAAPVGRYALQLLFSDGHDRGIYPWSLLRALHPVE